VGFGDTDTSAVTALLQSFAYSFESHRETYLEQWRRSELDDGKISAELGPLGRHSRMILLAHEDKIFQGAMAASLSIPWGEVKGDSAMGGYHLIWTRDLVQSATALLSTGQTATPLRALIWLAAIQQEDGSVPQNSWANGEAYYEGNQLDETAALVLLAWRLRAEKALGLFDPWPVVAKSVSFLMNAGPVTDQERWEENSGYSPSTLAAVTAAMTAAADFAQDRQLGEICDAILAYADWLNAHIDAWTVTTCGEVHPEISRHYILLTPADAKASELKPDPDRATISIANGGGPHPARNIVSADFLSLVRLGLRRADDPLVLNSLQVVDRVLKHELPAGPAWRRYVHDGYGQKSDGAPYDGTGIGRCWPILTGERGHHALALGEDARPYLATMEKFANEGGLIPEQVWDEPDSPDGSCRMGAPTGAAMPLCWSHAEYLTLVRSVRDGKVYDRIESAHQRYAVGKTGFTHDHWSPRYRRVTIQPGKVLRLVLSAAARVRWTREDWRTQEEVETRPSGFGALWFVDLPTAKLAPGTRVEFTFYWLEAQRWEGVAFAVSLANP
jgi:glucoamylase